MHHKKKCQTWHLSQVLYAATFHIQGNDHLLRSDKVHQIRSQLSTSKFYINSGWENGCLLYYGKNLLKMDIWKSFHHFSNKWASDKGLFILYKHTHNHICVCMCTYTHTYIHTPHLRHLQQNSLNAFKMFHILLVIWTDLLKI